MSVMIATSPTTCSTSPRAIGTTSGLTSNTPSVEPMSPPSMAPRPIDVQITTFCRDSPRSMSTSGSAASEASMNHASSGPLSSARNTPWSADTMASSSTVSATSSRLMAAIENKAGQDQHRLAAEGVGQPAARQLEEQHDDALRRGAQPDLRERQAPLQHQQHEHRDEEPRRHEPQGQQQVEAAADRPEVGGAHTTRSGLGNACSRSVTRSAPGSAGAAR